MEFMVYSLNSDCTTVKKVVSEDIFVLFQPKPLMQQTPVIITELPVPKDPPPEFEFLADPPTISALDLYVLCVFGG